MKRLNKVDKKKNYYSYGPVVVLMAACVCVMAAIVLAMVMPDTVKIDEGKEKIEISENIENSGNTSEDTENQDQAEGDGALTTEDQGQTLGENEGQVTGENENQADDENDGQSAGGNEGPAAGESTGQSEGAVEDAPLFTVSDITYFDDALFIGDSRTVGLREYGTFENAHYFASPGLSLYSIDSTKVEMRDGRKVKLEQLLTENTYGKVYVMLGINELGYDFDATVRKYQTFIDYIFTMQPDAILYVCANMHVNSLRNELDDIHNNAAINRMNEQIASFADNEKIFYLDINPVFDDENGNLAQEYISDDTHLMGNYYEDWCNWYCENTVVLTDC